MADEKTVTERFNEVNNKTMNIIEEYVTGGYQKSLANLLIYMGEERAKSVLEKLPEPVRFEVEKYLEVAVDEEGKKLSRTSPLVILEAAGVFKKADWYGDAMAKDFMIGLTPGQISETNANIEKYFKENPILAANIENNIFNFED